MERNGKTKPVSDSGTLGSPRVPKLNGMIRFGTKPVIDRWRPQG